MDHAILGLQVIKEQPSKVFSEVEKMKWSLIFWSSSLSEAFKRSRDMVKVKTKLTDAFRATQPMCPPIPALRIV